MPIQPLQTKSSPAQTSSEESPPPAVRPKKRRSSWFWWKVSIALVLTLVVFAGALGYRILAAVNTTTNGNQRVSVLTQLGHLVANRDAQLKGEAQDRVNILLLGIGGAGHEGPLLTDTIILASVKPSTGSVSLLSIPRDLAVEIPPYGIRKINNANAFGKQLDYPGGGEQLVVDVVSRVMNQPIQYFARIDFSGFKEIVDNLGGINITVEKSFSDYEYPTNDFGYQTVTFKAGEQKMNGDTALKFVRSRHGNNGEGSDFARSRRQQLVLEAIRGKAFSLGTIINPVKIGSTLSSLGNHTRTNLEVWELLRLARLVKDATGSNLVSRVLDSSPTGPLKNTTGLDGAFLLEPKIGFQDFRAVKLIAQNVFDTDTIATEAATILIIDQTGKSGSGRLAAEILESAGYPEPSVQVNRDDQALATTAVIDDGSGRRPVTLRTLRTFFGLTQAAGLDPFDLQTFLGNLNRNVPTNANVDATANIIILLGQDFLTSAPANNILSRQ